MSNNNQTQLQLMDADETKNGHDVVRLSPMPPELLIKLQKFQKQLDRPPRVIIEENIAGEKFKHVPISYIEHSLKKIYFGLYKIEIINYGMIVNEIAVHVRIHVFHPLLGQWLTYDGVGAIPILQDKGTAVSQFIEAKKRKALALNLPAAYSSAVKNAAKKIGKIFGGDLNRKHEDVYTEYNIELPKPVNE